MACQHAGFDAPPPTALLKPKVGPNHLRQTSWKSSRFSPLSEMVLYSILCSLYLSSQSRLCMKGGHWWVSRALMGQLVVSALQESAEASKQQHCPCTALLWGIASPGQSCPSAYHWQRIWIIRFASFWILIALSKLSRSYIILASYALIIAHSFLPFPKGIKCIFFLLFWHMHLFLYIPSKRKWLSQADLSALFRFCIFLSKVHKNILILKRKRFPLEMLKDMGHSHDIKMCWLLSVQNEILLKSTFLSRKKYHRKANALWQGKRKNWKGSPVATATSQSRRPCHWSADYGHALLWYNSYLFSGNSSGNVWHTACVSPPNYEVMRPVVTMCHIHQWCGHGGLSAFTDIEFDHRRLYLVQS